MKAFFYGAALQWKLDIRNKTLLLNCYLIPLVFFAIMGGIFTSVMPQAKDTLIQSMTIFGITMGALLGVPPSLVEIYSSDIKKVYQANGVPLALGAVLVNLSAFVHLLIMSGILYLAAPKMFDAATPKQPIVHFLCVAVFIVVSLGVASTIGLAVKDQTKTSMVSILIFLPSIMLSGIMFPVALLPKVFANVGKIFPATWGYTFMAENTLRMDSLMALVAILIITSIACIGLLYKIRKQ